MAGLDSPQAHGQSNGFAAGAAVGDFDNDGYLDIFVPRVGLPNLLYHNERDGTFKDVAEAAGVIDDNSPDGSGAGVWGDVNGDGRLDLVVIGLGRTADKLYLNRGAGFFSNNSDRSGLRFPRPFPASARGERLGGAFADYDLDGDLDLVIVQWNAPGTAGLLDEPSDETGSLCQRLPSSRHDSIERTRDSRARLLSNDGNGRFSDVTSQLHLSLGTIDGFTPVFSDFDQDGWPDLFITGDFCTSRVFRNVDGGLFVDVTESLGLGGDENGMGSAIEDINSDGHVDWLVTSVAYPTESGLCPSLGPSDYPVGCSGNRLYLNNGLSEWQDATDYAGVRDGGWGWGVAMQDFDNDGDRDIVQANGFDLATYVEQSGRVVEQVDRFREDRIRFWLNDGIGQFVPSSSAVGLVSTALGKALIAFDFDRDGDLDIFVANTGTAPNLYRNDLSSTNGSIDVALHDPSSKNIFGVGATITAESARLPLQYAEIRASGSYGGSSPTEAHFAIAPFDTLRLTVRWPDGATTVLDDVSPGRVVVGSSSAQN